MIIEITIGVLGFAVGIGIGLSITDDKTTKRLRNRGYVIEKEDSYYCGTTWKFVYRGFDDKLNHITSEGHQFSNYDDAVANADAHFFAKTFKIES